MRSRSQTYLLIVSVLVILTFVLLVRHQFAPPDLVEIRLQGIPPDVHSIYLVAKNQDEMFSLNWYLSKLIYFPATTKEAGEQWYQTERDDERKGMIQWVPAESYGILARLHSGRWVVWWLPPENIDRPSLRRYIWGGGDRVRIHVPPPETSQTAQESLLDQVVNGNL